MITPDLQGMGEKAEVDFYLDFTLYFYLKAKCGDCALMIGNTSAANVKHLKSDR